MEPNQFDHLARGMAARGTRRNLLRGLSGIAAGSLAALGLGQQGRFSRALQDAGSTEEQSVILYEQMAEIARQHRGACPALRAATAAFLQDNADLLNDAKAEQDAWDTERKTQHADTYGDRLQAASEALSAALSRCEFVKGDTTFPPDLATPAATPDASPAALGDVARAYSQDPLNAYSCPYAVTAFCVNSVTHATSGTFTGYAICASTNQDCSVCTSASYCSENYPSVCVSSSGANQCSVAWQQPQPPDCCHKNCPISASDCALNWGGGITTPDDCLRCMTSWCGSTDYCISNCEANDCCSEPCSESTPPSPPEGGP